jgi:4-amino-4-deoxy-L-arabinose transferase-like glycosyltransferase
MAGWGIDEFRTALYHYPYLPWTFIFSAPFKALADVAAGWYDQRFVYLLLFAVTLLMLPGLTGLLKAKLLLVMLVGLNPIMGSDLIFGQNDSFVLAWVVIGLWLWVRGMTAGAGRGWRFASGVALGLAIASKPTTWFLIPFLGLWVAGLPERGSWSAWMRSLWQAIWPVALAVGLVVLPYLIWDAGAMFDDVWRWSAGTSPTAYQIWGWGAANFVLAFGGVADRFAYWPFWLPELLIGLPVLIALLWRQRTENTLSRALWGYGIFLLAFFFVSRFLNENYLGYIAAFLALGALVDPFDSRSRSS